MSTEPKRMYSQIDQRAGDPVSVAKSELSFIHQFKRVQLLIVRRVGDKELADEMLNDLELFRQGLLRGATGNARQKLAILVVAESFFVHRFRTYSSWNPSHRASVTSTGIDTRLRPGVSSYGVFGPLHQRG